MTIPSGADLAKSIRDRVQDLNDVILLAALAELDVEFEIRKLDHAPRAQLLSVYISQEV